MHADRADAVVGDVVAFGRLLRLAGLEVGPGRVADAVAGLDAVRAGDGEDVYWTLRATLVSRREDLEAFDSAFRLWFLGAGLERGDDRFPDGEPERLDLLAAAEGEGGETETTEVAEWSPEEALRTKDFALMTPEEVARAEQLVAEIAAGRPMRRSRRLRASSRGDDLHMRRLVRRSLATGGEPLDRAYRRRIEVPRKLVVVCDVSGSMEAYARPLLLFMRAIVGSGRRAEAFAFGTRLTRLTRELATRDVDRALAAAASRVADWSGGTQIGASLKALNDEWGRRGVTRGAVVVIVSDGWERGDPALVRREMARLSRHAFAVVWVNPRKGHPDYEPRAGGMQAALPYVDRFLPGHDLASLEELAGVLAGIARRHAA
jgi:uncharacterized protein with von Willebrand factor type A (vWA) domain